MKTKKNKKRIAPLFKRVNVRRNTEAFLSCQKLKFFSRKRVPVCDYHGTCTNKAYREVYPSLGKKHKYKGWSYLCRKHFEQEQKRFKWKLPCCGID